MLFIILTLIFGMFCALALYVLFRLSRRQFLKQRLESLVSQDPNMGFVHTPKPKLSPEFIARLSKFGTQAEKETTRVKALLGQAGYYREHAGRMFVGMKVLCAAVMLSSFIMFGLAVHDNTLLVGLVTFAMTIIGYALPNMLLNARARQRQLAISMAMPDALDFLIICVEAGLGLNAAIMRVGRELSLSSKALSEELRMVMQEVRSGLSREEALRNLSERNDVKELKTLTGAIILSDKLGTNLSDTLRIQSDFLRTRILQKAEEGAAKAGVKLLLPLVLLIMPSLFIVILAPGLILASKKLLPMLF